MVLLRAASLIDWDRPKRGIRPEAGVAMIFIASAIDLHRAHVSLSMIVGTGVRSQWSGKNLLSFSCATLHYIVASVSLLPTQQSDDTEASHGLVM